MENGEMVMGKVMEKYFVKSVGTLGCEEGFYKWDFFGTSGQNDLYNNTFGRVLDLSGLRVENCMDRYQRYGPTPLSHSAPSALPASNIGILWYRAS